MDNVRAFGFSDNLIERLADAVLDHAAQSGMDRLDLRRICVVFGGRRPQLFLKKALARRIGQPFLPPSFFSMDEFVDYTCAKTAPRGRADDLSSCFLLYQLAKQRLPELLRNRESFSRFLAWAREILNFIEQLDFQDIPDGPLKEIELSATIGYEVPESVNELLRHTSLLRQSFHEALSARGLFSRGMAYREASASVASGETAYPEFGLLIFCNFFFLHATERALIKRLYDGGKAMLVFQRDCADWSVLERLEKELGITIPAVSDRDPGPRIRMYTGFDTHSQVSCCRQILASLPKDEKTVVVLPDPDALVPLLSEIASLSPDLNVSLGYPVKRSSLYSLFTLISQAQSSRKGAMYYARDYLKTLSHPLAKNICADAAVSRVLVHKVEEILTGIIGSDLSGTLFVDLDRIESSAELFKHARKTLAGMGTDTTADGLRDILAGLHRLLFRNWENGDTFAGFCRAGEELLARVIDASPPESHPLNLMACNTVLDMIGLLKRGRFDAGESGREEIFRIFLNDLESRVLSFTGSPLRGLQVLGLFETRSLNFENVIVLDVNEQSLPNLSIYEPLIPREVMLGLGLNRIEKEDEIQRYQFFRLIKGARNVHLIYSSGTEKEKSRFLEELIWDIQKKNGSLDVAIPRLAFTVKIQPGRKEARKTPEMIAALRGRRLSANSLNIYLMCPMRFYYQYLLGLEEKTDMLDDTEARDVGTFCHDLLEKAFTPYVNGRPAVDAAFRQRFFALFEERFNHEFERTQRPDSFLLKEILKVRLEAFLDKEAGREVDRIVCLEQKSVDALTVDGIEYPFEYRIDRIDRMQDGSLMVIDYKSGGADIKPAPARTILAKGMGRQQLKRTLKSFQLPLYMFFVRRHYPGCRVNACLYSLRSAAITTLLKPDDEEGQETFAEVFLAGLQSLLAELLDPSVPFACDAENSQYCAICPFTRLCR